MMDLQSNRSLRSKRTAEEFEVISAEFIRALRGSQSQSVLSRRLGFTSNVVYQWESSRRTPSLTDAMRAAEICRVKPAGQRLAAKLQTPEGVGDIIGEMTIGQSLSELADAIGISRSALSRWRSGTSLPSFSKFLHLLDLATGRMVEFLAVFVDPALIPSVAEIWTKTSELRALANLMPMFVPTLCALDLDGYRQLPLHDEAWLGSRLGLSVDEIRYALRRIEGVGAIRFDGTHYVVDQATFDLFQAGSDVVKQLDLKKEHTGFYAGTTSHAVVERARAEVQLLLLRIQDMIETDPGPKEQIAMFAIQIGRLDVAPPKND